MQYGRKAVLIQDIRDLTSAIMPKITEIFNQYGCNISYIDFVGWLICRLLEDIYCININNFNYKDSRYTMLYDLVRNNIPNLDLLFSHYIKGPKIYSDRHIWFSVEITNTRLVITYYSNKTDFNTSD